MNKKFLPLVAWATALTVVMGAMGAHALQTKLLPAQMNNYETALRYQFFHLLALLITGLFSLHFSTFSFRWVTRFFIAGILLFSGSIYLIIICKYMQVEFPRLLVLLTPLGGVCLTAGWITLAITLQRAVTQKVEN